MNSRLVLFIVAFIALVAGIASVMRDRGTVSTKVEPPAQTFAQVVQPIPRLHAIAVDAVTPVTDGVQGGLPFHDLDGRIAIEDIGLGDYVTSDKAVLPSWFLDPRNQSKIREKFRLEVQSFPGAFPDWLIGKLRPGHRVNVYVTKGDGSPPQDLVAADVLVIDVATSAGGLATGAEPARPTATPAPGSPPTPASIITILADPSINWNLREYIAKGYRPWVTLSTAPVRTPAPPPTVTPTLEPPTLNPPSPPNSANYSVSWTSSSGATSYDLQESPDQAKWSAVYAGPSTSFSFSNKPVGTYYYRVRACNNSGCSDWSNVVSQKVEATEVIPPGVPTLNPPSPPSKPDYSVSWTSSSGATSYDLQESTDQAKWSSVYAGPSTSFSFSNKPDGTYYYRVRACNSSGCSGWSNVVSQTISPNVIHLILKNTPFEWQFDILSPVKISAAEIRETGDEYKRDFAGRELTLRVKNAGDPPMVYWIERTDKDDRAEVLIKGQTGRVNFEWGEEGDIVISLVGDAKEATVVLLDAGDEAEVK